MLVGFLAASGWAADGSSRLAAREVEILVATGGLPAHVAGRFSDPLAFHQSPAGDYIVFDRAAQNVYRIDHLTYEVTTLVEIGFEEGRVLGPRAFDLAPNGTFIIADSPRQRERLQLFSPTGTRFGWFTMPDKVVPRVVAGGLVLSGFGSLDYTGRSILVSQLARRALVTVYGLRGTAYRTFGNLRETGLLRMTVRSTWVSTAVSRSPSRPVASISCFEPACHCFASTTRRGICCSKGTSKESKSTPCSVACPRAGPPPTTGPLDPAHPTQRAHRFGRSGREPLGHDRGSIHLHLRPDW